MGGELASVHIEAEHVELALPEPGGGVVNPGESSGLVLLQLSGRPLEHGLSLSGSARGRRLIHAY
jgi:hypothetical protein